MNIRDGLNSMAMRVFLVLAIGMTLAAVVGFTIADVERRQISEKRFEDRIVSRVTEAVTRAQMSAGTARLKGPLATLPAAPDLEGKIAASSLDRAVTAEVRARLTYDGSMQVNVYKYANEACGPLPPTPPPPPGGLRPIASPAPPRLPAVKTECRLVEVLSPNQETQRLLIPVPPLPDDAPRAFSHWVVASLVLAALGLAFVVSRLTTAPLRHLAQAANALGMDLARPPLAVGSPTEVAQAAKAFNAMQMRLQQTLQDRTLMLAAITHDLQTPLTRQRLRIETMTDLESKANLLDDYRVMKDLIQDGLDLARSALTRAPLQRLDLSSMLESVQEDATAAGQDVTIVKTLDATVSANPAALRRCLTNLVDNAVKYGDRARLSAERTGDFILLSVSDDGPGIAPSQLNEATRPFVRLQGEDLQAGSGLGLAIAKLLASQTQAELLFDNPAEGGFKASIRLRTTTPVPTGQ